MLRRRPRRRADERGAVIVYFMLTLVMMLGMSAFAVDLGYDRQLARHLQNGADAGSLAAAQDLPRGAVDTTMAATARVRAATYAVQSLFDGAAPSLPTPSCTGYTCVWTLTDMVLTVTTPYTPPGGVSGTLGAQNLVLVRACSPTSNFFRKFLGQNSGTACRSAVGRRTRSTSSYQYGLVALHEHACAALQFRGNSETILSSTGGVMVRSDCTSSSSGALDSSGTTWELRSSFIGVVGSATLNPCDPNVTTVCTQTVPTIGIPTFDDPSSLSPIAAPATARNCNWTLLPIQIMQPGYYADACNMNSNRTYIMRSGVYWFASGFSTGGSATVICSDVLTTLSLDLTQTRCSQPSWNADGTIAQAGGVTIYVPGSAAEGCLAPSGCAVDMQGTGAVYLPGRAEYKGVAIFQRGTTKGGIRGNADFQIGSVYAPSALMEFTGNAGSDEVNVDGQVIASRVDIGGTFNFNIEVPGTSAYISLDDDLGLEY